MRYLFFERMPYAEMVQRFYRRILGGERVIIREEGELGSLSKETLERIKTLDGEDAVWFFTLLHPAAHRILKGRQILLRHGVGFKLQQYKQQTDLINTFVDRLFEGSEFQVQNRLWNGVRPEKIRRIGWATVFEVPKLPVRENAVLISLTKFTTWHPEDTTLEILRRFAPPFHGYVTAHPLYRKDYIEEIRELCRGNPNLTFVESENILEACSFCAMGMGQHSSMAAFFWYFQKPWIFIRGPMIGLKPLRGFNLFKGIGWERIRRQTHDKVFDRILKNSLKISRPGQFKPELLQRAKPCPTAGDVFFEWNNNEKEVARRIREAVNEVESESRRR